MKRIFAGKIYDTAKADKVAFYEEGIGMHNFTETLYRTRNGRLFLYGDGESCTKYNDSKLWPVDDDDAFEWLQVRQLVDEIVILFPDRTDEA